jgi:predicted metalloprotease with PDZ domain
VDNVDKIMRDHAKTTGLDLRGATAVMLAPYPGSDNRTGWSAEARGGNLILLASPNSQMSSGQLAVIMCHELFHLWMPNAVDFQGDYDWFFEGFTLYHALGIALRLKLIDFQEFLATLGRVYDSYQSSADRGKFSLIEFSRRRWTVGSTFVYDQGMLTAFLFDLKLRKSSNNQKELDDLFRVLFSRYYGSTKRVDGNGALISMMAELTSTDFVRTFVETPIDIKLETLLPEYGLRLNKIGGRNHLEIAAALSNEQQRLLSDLAYQKIRARAAFINY